MKRGIALGVALVALLAMAAPAGAGPVATSDGAYTALGRVFPDPMANCQRASGSGPCSPGAQGNVPVYVGQTTFATGEGSDTLEDPLAANVNQPGSRFNTGMRRQMFEPTPLGFAIQEPSGNDASFSRQWQVNKDEWEKAGGRTAGTSADAGDRDAAPVYSQVTLGELKRGKGQIRIAGALLPQRSEEFDHQFGIEPYAVTYTGYIVVRNLFGGRGALPGSFDTGRNFVISRRAVKLRKGRAGVRVSCRIPRGGCRGVLRLRIKRPVRGSAEAAARKKKRRYRTIGRKRFNIPSGRKRNFVVKVKSRRAGARR